jgi:autotransporter-associated beta strand protein
LAGEQLDRKGQASSAHRIAVYSAEAVLAQPVTSTPDTPAGIEKLGKGQLTLQAANAFTGNMVVRDGTLCFDSPAAMAGTGRTICPDNGSVVAANFPIDNAFLQRLESPSAMAYTVALGTDSSAPLDFQSNAGAILRAATLGATGEVTYSGKITPCDGLLKLGGGGGTLKVTDPANVPTIVGGSLTPGRVVLPDGVKLPENFVLLQGSLTIGSTPYKAPEIATTISPAPMPSTPPEGVSASANDRWVDALWNFPINPEGGFAVEWSTDGKTFEPAGKAWPEERRFPIFLKKSAQNFLGSARRGVRACRGDWSRREARSLVAGG